MIKSCRRNRVVVLMLTALALTGCANPTASQQELLTAGASQVQLRDMQSRVFDTTDTEKTLRTVMATLQDLDFLINRADLLAGVVTGTRYDDDTAVDITVTVRPRNDSQIIVRASVQYGLRAVESVKPYQDFFTTLEKSMFLAAHEI